MANGDGQTTKTAFAVVGAVAGGAAWVSLVGSVLVAFRLQPLRVPPGPTIAAMPTEHRFVVGMQFLVLPLLAALLAYLFLLWRRPSEEVAERDERRRCLRHSAAGSVPPGMGYLLVVAPLAVGVGAAGATNVSVWFRLLLLAVPFVGAGLTFVVVRRIAGWAQATFVFFVGVALTAGAMAVAYEAGRETRLDTVAVLRKDGSSVTGFYVTKSSDAVYVVTATVVGRGIDTDTPPEDLPALQPKHKRCKPETERYRLRGLGPRCYLNELVVVPFSDVRRIVLGPRSVAVNPTGYLAAKPLAYLAGLPGDKPPAAAGQDGAGR